MHHLAQLTRRPGAALLIAVTLVLAGAQADAGRAPARKPTVAGAKPKAWKAGNTNFTHETLKDSGGNVIHWERTAKKAGKKAGTTKVTGATWGSSYKGHEWERGNNAFRAITMAGSDGSKTKQFSVTNAKGTKKTTITGLPGGVTRRITAWKAGNTVMTHTRDYDASGKVIKQHRSGNKAQ